jgi:hypothetical protein
MGSCGLGQGTLTECCEHANEIRDPQKTGNFLKQLSDNLLHMKEPAPWNLMTMMIKVTFF